MGLEEKFIHISPIEMPEWMASDCAQIAENFAIGFKDYCDNINDFVLLHLTTKQLLEIYKKTL